MVLSGIVSGDKNNGIELIIRNIILGYCICLEFNISFWGDDDLFICLFSGNLEDYGFIVGIFQLVLGVMELEDGNFSNSVLYYIFFVMENICLWVMGVGGVFDDFINIVNVLDGDGVFGVLIIFGICSLIYFLGEGIGVVFQGIWDKL